MKFNDIFALPIDRHLDGVIKTDQKAFVGQELDEYVLTPEIRRSLQRFCDEYNEPHSEGNGAWISGFYGSGKSHLLKILSYLLENPVVENRMTGESKPALDYLKRKLTDDPMLLGALEKACERTPSKSILFNIGAKADTGNTRDALLSAFIKVLNEACGYYAGTAAHIAHFERELDRIGLYQEFTERFRAETGKRWDVVRRKQATSMAGAISRVYDEVTGNETGTHADIIESYARDYHPSHEDFADWCAEYIERQGPGFRLNFLVDEVGQFVGANDDLLFSLQNVAELLNTRCHGRAWVIVVSQENVEDIIGDFRRRGSAKDFTKIQARFKVKIKIPSNDANTVVRDRLLEKAPSSLGPIDRLYERYGGDFNVLFRFPSGATQYALYQGEEDFEAYYPMVPYQFPLFHRSLTGLSDHNAFTGEYASTGARNMLGATRNALLAAKDGSVERGDLIPFDALFEGLRGELKSEAFEAVNTCEDHFADDPDHLGLRIVKVLLLVKYDDNFKATPQNLRVLLYSGFSEDAVELEERIGDMLHRLEADNYVRRNGDAYEYLTNEEKDVEAEIKRETVTDAEIRREIGKLFSENVVKQCRVRYDNLDFSNVYAYDVRVDGTPYKTSSNALSLDILTDLYDGGREQYVMAAGVRELTCALPESPRLIAEVRLLLQTQSWATPKLSGDQHQARIAKDKIVANTTRRDELKALLRELVASASWATCLVDVTADVKGSGAVERVDAAVRLMVSKSYPLLDMLTTKFDNTSIYKASTGSKLLPGESMPGYATEVLDEVQRVLAQSDRCTVGGSGSNSLESRLGGGQHGWPASAVRQAVGLLANNGRVECMRNDKPLEGASLGRDLSQGRALNDVTVSLAREIDPRTLAALREAHKAITGTVTNEDDARDIVDAVHADLTAKLDMFSATAGAAHSFPFSIHYEELLAKLRAYEGYTRDALIGTLGPQGQEMASVISELRDMSSFVNGQQGKRYLEAVDFLRVQDANISCCSGAKKAARQMREVLADQNVWRNNTVPSLRRLTREIEDTVKDELKAAKVEARSDLDAFAGNFRKGDYARASEEARSRADEVIGACESEIESTSQIQVARNVVSDFKKRRAGELYAIVAPPTPVPPMPPTVNPDDPPVDSYTPPVEVKTLTFDQVGIPTGYAGRTLTSEEDVRQFVYALTKRLMEHVQNNEKIIL